MLYAESDLDRADGPAFGLNLNTGPGMATHVALDPDEDPRFWFVIDVAMARRTGRRLAGAAADQVLPDLPRALVLGALLESIAWHRRHAGPDVDPVASAGRAWAWAVDGRWRPKREGAEWARARVGDGDPVAAAESELTAQLARAGPARPAGGG